MVSLQWYDGKIGPAAEEDAPALVICYDNGRVQMMASEADESEDKIVKKDKKFHFVENCN